MSSEDDNNLDNDNDVMEEEEEYEECPTNQKVRQNCSKHSPSVVSLCSDVEEVEDVVTPVDHEDGGHFVNGGDLDMSYSSGESEASSEFSALRFRDSPFSSSSR